MNQKKSSTIFATLAITLVLIANQASATKRRCDTIRDATFCNRARACVWQEENGCLNKEDPGDCARAKTPLICSDMTSFCSWTGKRCVFRQGANRLLDWPWAPLRCENYETKFACAPDRCIWEDRDNRCIEKHPRNCAMLTTEAHCLQVDRCAWFSHLGCILPGTLGPCERARSLEICKTAFDGKCDWTGDFCMHIDSKVFFHLPCDEYIGKEFCKTPDGYCFWDDKNGCLDALSAHCYEASSNSSCSSIYGCRWEPSEGCVFVLSPLWWLVSDAD